MSEHVPEGSQKGSPCRFTDTVPRVATSTVKVMVPGDGSGTAFYIGDGEFITARHVVEGRTSVFLANESYRGFARVVGHGLGDAADVSLLTRIDDAPSIAPLRWRQDQVRSGMTLGVAGYPYGFGDFPSISTGAVLNMTPLSAISHIGIDTEIKPGNSGGPLFDTCGRVAGMVTSEIIIEGEKGPINKLGIALDEFSLRQVLNDIRVNAVSGVSAEVAHSGIQVLGSTDVLCTVVDETGWPLPHVPVSASVVDGAGGVEESAERWTDARGQAAFAYRAAEVRGTTTIEVRSGESSAFCEVQVTGPPTAISSDAPETMEPLDEIVCRYTITDDEGVLISDVDASVRLISGGGLLEVSRDWFTYLAPATATGREVVIEIRAGAPHPIVSIISIAVVEVGVNRQ